MDAKLGAGSDAPPAAVARGGLVLVRVHLAGGVLGDDGRVVGADQAPGVQVLDDLVVGRAAVSSGTSRRR